VAIVIPNLECITILLQHILHAFPLKQSCQAAQYARRIVLFYEGHGGEIVGLYERQSSICALYSLLSIYGGSIMIWASNGKMQQRSQSFILLSSDRN